jgi:hypothetical protein
MAESFIQPQRKLYLPHILNNRRRPCGLNAEAWWVVQQMAEADWQQRPSLQCIDKLVAAAKEKVRKLDEGYLRAHALGQPYTYDHTTWDGETPNELVRRFGVRLPDWYPDVGNHIESLSLGHGTPESALAALRASPAHADHIEGRVEFFRAQTMIGVWFERFIVDGAVHPGRFTTITVVLTVPPES